jgi:tetratricopeptide (TPR) repeat protein
VQHPTGLRLRHLGYALEGEAAAAKADRNIRLLQLEVEARPEDEYFHYQLGKSHFSVKQYDLAAVSLERALQCMDWREPRLPRGLHGPVSRKVLTDLLTSLAYACANLDRVEDARALLLHHLRLGHAGTQRADFYHALGYIELVCGHLAAAREAYEQSLRLGAEAEDVLGAGSYASLYHLGLIAEAEDALDTAWARYAQSLRTKSDYETTLRRSVNLCAERRIELPRTIAEAARREQLHRVYLDCLVQFLENAKVQEAGHLAKSAAQWDPELFQRCRSALHAFATKTGPDKQH